METVKVSCTTHTLQARGISVFCWAPRYALGGAHERRKLLLEAPVAGPPAAMQEMASEGLSLRRIAKD